MNNSLIQPENTLIVVALEDELPTHLVAGWNVLYTGVGKVNAAIAATEVLEAAGFEVQRVPGFGRKRHMIRGSKR